LAKAGLPCGKPQGILAKANEISSAMSHSILKAKEGVSNEENKHTIGNIVCTDDKRCTGILSTGRTTCPIQAESRTCFNPSGKPACI